MTINTHTDNRDSTNSMDKSQVLNPLSFPLHGSRLIEASAGTGKTWTIAALYVRLVLGHGGEEAFSRPLLPAEILVMTFTRAATRELSNRIRERLVEAAKCFRGELPKKEDVFLCDLSAAYTTAEQRQQAAHRLMLAAETMDEAAIFTIDAWCQRMLREHAFDSGSLFDEELVSDESALLEDAVRDYWRQQVYQLGSTSLTSMRKCWADVSALEKDVRPLVPKVDLLGKVDAGSLNTLITAIQHEQDAALDVLKAGWSERADRMQDWIAAQQTTAPKCFSGVKFKAATVAGWFKSLHEWALDPKMVLPTSFDKAWSRLSPDGILDACNKGHSLIAPKDFAELAVLKTALDAITPMKLSLLRHATSAVALRVAYLKQSTSQFGFADMLTRLRVALLGDNGKALRERIVKQFPLAMIDEFQDTSPEQYQIFDALYQVSMNRREQGLFLIGDPKQSIYGFRGADIHSYLSARLATAGRHYLLGTNYRSTTALVQAVNQLFLYAEGAGENAGFASGAFKFRTSAGNPLPFDAVVSKGRGETLVGAEQSEDTGGASALPALNIWCSDEANLDKDDYHTFFAARCAETIVQLLNNSTVGFQSAEKGFKRLQPADIAILVRDRNEAAAIRQALQRRTIASVYLSDKDSVIDSDEAADVLRWLRAVSSPLDSGLGRAAFATATAGLSLNALAIHASDDRVWEQRVEQLKGLHQLWQRQGVLAMLRRFIHDLGLPASLLSQAGGERRLTNLLHLAELLQSASQQLDGEQALIRWLAEQIDNESDAGDERILRLESDAELVKVVTVHKSKGLEYPLVFLPFAVSARPATTRNRSFLEYADDNGEQHIDLTMSANALARMEAARIEEDIRLLYVALTRARHALWLGVASLKNKIHESALGYLLAGGETVTGAQLAEALTGLKGACSAITVEVMGPVDEDIPRTRLSRKDERPALIDALPYNASFERDWAVGSFTSLTRAMNVTGNSNNNNSAGIVASRAQEEKLLENPDSEVISEFTTESITESITDASINSAVDATIDAAIDAAIGAIGASAGNNMNNTVSISSSSNNDSSAEKAPDAVWHQFPRGPLPGQFLHAQLEWMGLEGFAAVDDDKFSARLALRCERAGWGHRQQETDTWLQAVAKTSLGPLDASLYELDKLLPEMEFWFPSDRLPVHELDQLCQRHLLPDMPRPSLPERQLHGMLKGYADLVFEHEGRYWVLDYKSNWLGTEDASYHATALSIAMASHRYDVQGALYLLALHRLLKSRLGSSYDPATQLGGALFFFLRGIGNTQTHGCHHLQASATLLDALDHLFTSDNVKATATS
jgi:exodeoxyribonuclease V beta subunit